MLSAGNAHENTYHHVEYQLTFLLTSAANDERRQHSCWQVPHLLNTNLPSSWQVPVMSTNLVDIEKCKEVWERLSNP